MGAAGVHSRRRARGSGSGESANTRCVCAVESIGFLLTGGTCGWKSDRRQSTSNEKRPRSEIFSESCVVCCIRRQMRVVDPLIVDKIYLHNFSRSRTKGTSHRPLSTFGVQRMNNSFWTVLAVLCLLGNLDICLSLHDILSTCVRIRCTAVCFPERFWSPADGVLMPNSGGNGRSWHPRSFSTTSFTSGR